MPWHRVPQRACESNISVSWDTLSHAVSIPPPPPQLARKRRPPGREAWELAPSGGSGYSHRTNLVLRPPRRTASSCEAGARWWRNPVSSLSGTAAAVPLVTGARPERRWGNVASAAAGPPAVAASPGPGAKAAGIVRLSRGLGLCAGGAIPGHPNLGSQLDPQTFPSVMLPFPVSPTKPDLGGQTSRNRDLRLSAHPLPSP